VRDVLYLHGFASSPQGAKSTALRDLLGPRGLRLVAPDLNAPTFERLDFDAMAEVAIEAARETPPAVVVGSSLGALVALEIVRRGVRAPLVLISPALAFAARFLERLPPDDPISWFHHGRGQPAKIHRAFFERMARVAPDAEAPSTPVTVVMGRLDESVPFALVEDVWRGWRAGGRLVDGSEFVAVSNGDHGLVQAAPILAAAIERRAVAENEKGGLAQRSRP
jgi:pimeloyl-ACP methyl ester carboxylesterase